MIDITANTSIGTSLFHTAGSVDEVFFVGVSFSSVSGLLYNVTATITWDDGTAIRTETFLLNLLLANQANRVLQLRCAAGTDINYSLTLVGSGVYNFTMGLTSSY